MATISNTPRPGYAWDAQDNVWYPIGTGTHGHPDYITQATAINPSTITTKGDLIVGTGAGTFVRQGVGTDGQVLVADSAQADGVNWATVSSSLTLAQVATGSLTSGTTLTLSSLTGDYYLIHFSGIAGSTNSIRLTFNGSSAAVYDWSGSNVGQSTSSYDNNGTNNDTSISLFPSNQSGSSTDVWIEIKNAKAAGFTNMNLNGYYNSGGQNYLVTSAGIFKTAAQVTSMTFTRGSAFTAGTYTVWGG